MCGLNGQVNFNKKPVLLQDIKYMNRALSHRGPDAEGCYIYEEIGLGHRRLSIIDISDRSNQPMVSEDKNYVLIFNGEIYNFKELRKDLKKKNIQFKTKSDTEVLLQFLIFYGTKTINKLNGMFSFAFFDKKKRELVLCRDRYGIKPLYVYMKNNTLLFSSEIKSLFKNPEFLKSINLDSLYEYFCFQNILSENTFFNNVKVFPPGCFAIINCNLKKINFSVNKYWDFNFQTGNDFLNKKECMNELDFLFKQGVKRQFVSDVEIATYLSGGLDSSAIATILSTHNPNFKSFTCGFDMNSVSGLETTYDERKTAEKISYRLKSEHYQMVLKSGDMEKILPKLIWHLDEPRLGQSYPNFYMAKLASKFVKVVLSGIGGDEIFGGYPWRYYKNYQGENFDSFVKNYFHQWQRLTTDRENRNLFNPVRHEINEIDNFEIFKSIFNNSSKKVNTVEDTVNLSLYFESKTFLSSLLMIEDKISMAHGVESRVPFLDNDLVDFAMKCPIKYKIGNLKNNFILNENEVGNKFSNYFQRSNEGKKILREYISKYIPKEVAYADKQGFSAPDATWFRGDSIEYIREKFLINDSNIYNFLDKKIIKNIINEHLSGKQNRRLFIWSILSFDTWINQNF